MERSMAVNKKRVMITGANGQLGRAVNLQYADSGEYELINTDVGELDITNIDKVMTFVREVKPYAIINCAAYTAVEPSAFIFLTNPTPSFLGFRFRICFLRTSHNV